MEIDLKELLVRESERVEWKENVADFRDVVATLVAFSNDLSNLGGGFVVCGAREVKDEHGFPKVDAVGLTASQIREIENRVLDHCRSRVDPAISPLVEEQQSHDPARRLLVFIAPQSQYAHMYRRDNESAGKYFVRSSRSTIEARDGLLRDLLLHKKAIEPWDRRACAAASLDDIDIIALRDYLKQMGLLDPTRALEDYLSDKERISSFVPTLAAKSGLDNGLHPRYFAILFFGRNPLEFIPGAYVIFSIYRGVDRSEPNAERVEITGTLPQQARRVLDLLDAEAVTAFDKTSATPNQVKYPKRALQEAVLNALAHRDYESEQPVRVTVFSNRIEIASPGGLPRAIDIEKFKAGRATAYWRNQSLAYFLNRLQLAQGEGQGIPTIIRTMREEGCPEPIFDIESERVICLLPAHPRHAIMRELAEIENKMIIGNYADALRRLEQLMEDDPNNYRCIELFCEVNNLNKTPERLLALARSKSFNPSAINTGTLFLLAEALSSLKDNREAIELASVLNGYASSQRLEESELKRVALTYRRLGEDEKALELVDQAFLNSPSLRQNPTLCDIAARARMELAKKCIESARRQDGSTRIRARAWDLARDYLEKADVDIRQALEYETNPTERDYILRDLEFCQHLQNMARKPSSARHTGGKRGKGRH